MRTLTLSVVIAGLGITGFLLFSVPPPSLRAESIAGSCECERQAITDDGDLYATSACTDPVTGTAVDCFVVTVTEIPAASNDGECPAMVLADGTVCPGPAKSCKWRVRVVATHTTACPCCPSGNGHKWCLKAFKTGPWIGLGCADHKVGSNIVDKNTTVLALCEETATMRLRIECDGVTQGEDPVYLYDNTFNFECEDCG